jgi:hypothetical protein
MTTRTKFKERAKRKKKMLMLMLIKLLLIALSFLILIGLTVNFFNKTNAIVISNTHYNCQPKGCDYSFTVNNLSSNLVKGYARINSFKTSNISGLNSDEVLSTERIEFILKASKKKEIKGYYLTGIETEKLTISVGEVKSYLW